MKPIKGAKKRKRKEKKKGGLLLFWLLVTDQPQSTLHDASDLDDYSLCVYLECQALYSPLGSNCKRVFGSDGQTTCAASV